MDSRLRLLETLAFIARNAVRLAKLPVLLSLPGGALRPCRWPGSPSTMCVRSWRGHEETAMRRCSNFTIWID